MEKYTILIVLITFIGEYCGQVVISNVRGPAVIRNVHSMIENGSSVVNVVHDFNGDGTSVITTGSNGPVVIKDVSSTIIDGTSEVHLESNVHSHSSSGNGNHSEVLLVSTMHTGNADNRQGGNGAPGLTTSFWHLMFAYLITYLIL